MKSAISPFKPHNLARDVLIVALALLALPVFAQSTSGFDALTGSSGIGCTIVTWMKGPLAILIFVMVAVVTIVVGMFAKMDWTKILSIVVLFGILQGLATILGPFLSSVVSGSSGTTCL